MRLKSIRGQVLRAAKWGSPSGLRAGLLPGSNWGSCGRLGGWDVFGGGAAWKSGADGVDRWGSPSGLRGGLLPGSEFHGKVGVFFEDAPPRRTARRAKALPHIKAPPHVGARCLSGLWGSPSGLRAGLLPGSEFQIKVSVFLKMRRPEGRRAGQKPCPTSSPCLTSARGV